MQMAFDVWHARERAETLRSNNSGCQAPLSTMKPWPRQAKLRRFLLAVVGFAAGPRRRTTWAVSAAPPQEAAGCSRKKVFNSRQASLNRSTTPGSNSQLP